MASPLTFNKIQKQPKKNSTKMNKLNFELLSL